MFSNETDRNRQDDAGTEAEATTKAVDEAARDPKTANPLVFLQLADSISDTSKYGGTSAQIRKRWWNKQTG